MATTHHFDPTSLREYDIRGIIGKTLGPEDAFHVGRAFGSVIARQGWATVAVGYDGRHSSPELAERMAAGLSACGLTVQQIGRGPTPMLYFAMKHLGSDGGVMITGSHNPPEYNGIKMARRDGPVYGDQIQHLGRLAATGDYVDGPGTVQQHEVQAAYTNRLVQGFRPGRTLRVVWDAGNGATGDVLSDLVKHLPGEHTLLYADIDGDFPNHHPDPTVPEFMADLIATVKAERADLGIGFDGDGDRIGAVDETGRLMFGDQLMAIYAEDVLAEMPGATVIADVKTSKTVFDRIAELGGQPLMWKTGHSLIKAKMAETGAPLAGEMSGHINIGDRYYGFDDALYNAVRLIEIVGKGDAPVSALADVLPPVKNTPEVRFEVDEARKFAIIDEVKQRLAAPDAPQDISVNDIDGVRVSTPEGWWLLRASNTQNVLVARAESETDAGLETLKRQIVEQLEASGLSAPDFAGGGH